MSEKPARAAKAAKPKRAKAAGSTRAPKSAKPSTPAADAAPTHAEIADRAYYIHLHEGESDPLLNWLRAERELTGR